MNIVGINGFKRSGKGETAAALSRLHEGVVYEVGFADKLKILGAKILGYDLSPRESIAVMDDFKLRGSLKAVWDLPDGKGTREFEAVTGREFLQNLGNEARNVLGDTLWIDMVLPDPRRAAARAMGDTVSPEEILRAQVELMYPDVDVLAITDLRYENEAQRIKDLGGVVWEVIRPGLESDGHASEQPLPRGLVDWQIINDGDLDLLEDRVKDAIQETLSC